MIVTAHLNFFHISECGLYKSGGDEPLALNAFETFDSIYKWLADRSMEETLPWDPSTGRKGMAKCYRHDHYFDNENNDFLFVLWKSDGSKNGSILGASANSKLGDSEVIEYTSDHKGKKMIWGHPAYYWVIPKIKTIVSIKFDHSVCDSQLFQTWVNACINNRAQIPEKTKTFTNNGHTRFEFSTKDQQHTGLNFKFETKLQTLDTAEGPLLSLVHQITHIVKRETVKVKEEADDRSAWVKFFNKIDFVKPKDKSQTRKIEIRIEASPNLTEIKKIIQDFSNEDRDPKQWENVGFEKKDKTTVWVDEYRLSKKLNINYDGATVFEAGALYNFLSQRRADILKESEAITADLDAKYIAKRVAQREARKSKSKITKNSDKITIKEIKNAANTLESANITKT